MGWAFLGRKTKWLPNGHGYYDPGNGDNPSFTELDGAEVLANSLVKIEEEDCVDVDDFSIELDERAEMSGGKCRCHNFLNK